MFSFILKFKTLLILVIFICNSQLLLSQSFTNPIGDLADPHITYIDGFYYYTGTTGGDISMKRSITVEGLKQENITKLFGPGDQGAQDGNYWAPELFKLDGKWYIYYTASQTGNNTDTQRTYVLENANTNPLSKNWVFKGKIYSPGSDYWAIDGTVLELSGSRYFLWSGVDATTHFSGRDKPQRVFISLMSSPWKLTGSRALLVSPGEVSGGNIGDVSEAPVILMKDSKVFMIYSANGCWTSEYKLGMMSMDVADNPLNIGSWTKYPDPVFISNPTNNSYGPGHNSFYKSPDLTEYWIAYHATPNPAGECGNTRTTRTQKFIFDSNGIPQFRQVEVVGEPLSAPKGEPNLSIGIIENGMYRIKQKNTTKLVEIGGSIYTNPADIIQWENNGGLGQQWWFQATTDGYYTIVSALSGLSMEVGSCEFSEFANINIWTPNGANCQLWAIENIGSGDYRIINKNSGKVMEVAAAGINRNGGNIQQSTWSNGNNQKFNLELIKKTLNITESKFDSGITIYPIPAKNSFTISGLNSGDKRQIKIINMLGKTLKNIETNQNNYIVDTSNIHSGIYIIIISSERNETIMKRVLIN
jgi:GH43 family beta-xylosidase